MVEVRKTKSNKVTANITNFAKDKLSNLVTLMENCLKEGLVPKEVTHSVMRGIGTMQTQYISVDDSLNCLMVYLTKEQVLTFLKEQRETHKFYKINLEKCDKILTEQIKKKKEDRILWVFGLPEDEVTAINNIVLYELLCMMDIPKNYIAQWSQILSNCTNILLAIYETTKNNVQVFPAQLDSLHNVSSYRFTQADINRVPSGCSFIYIGSALFMVEWTKYTKNIKWYGADANKEWEQREDVEGKNVCFITEIPVQSFPMYYGAFEVELNEGNNYQWSFRNPVIICTCPNTGCELIKQGITELEEKVKVHIDTTDRYIQQDDYCCTFCPIIDFSGKIPLHDIVDIIMYSSIMNCSPELIAKEENLWYYNYMSPFMKTNTYPKLNDTDRTTRELIDKKKTEIGSILKGVDSALGLSGVRSYKNLLGEIDKYNIRDIKGAIQYADTKIIPHIQRNRHNIDTKAYLYFTSFQEKWGFCIMDYCGLNYNMYSFENKREVDIFNSELNHNIQGTSSLELMKNVNSCHFTIRLGNSYYIVNVEKRGDAVLLITITMNNLLNYSVSLGYKMGATLVEEGGNVLVMETQFYLKKGTDMKYSKIKTPDIQSFTSMLYDLYALSNKDDTPMAEIFSPTQLANTIESLLILKFNRKYAPKRKTIDTPVLMSYEIKPEATNDVIIYTDSIFDNFDIEIHNAEAEHTGSHTNHASPREHTRKGHMRTNPKTGKKDIKVKGCVVNEGHTPTTYETRIRKVKKEGTIND